MSTLTKEMEDNLKSWETTATKATRYAKENGYGLRAIKIYPGAWRDSHRFRASITYKGKKAGEARNHGDGGATLVDVWIGPPVDADLLEYWVDEVVNAEVEARLEKRLLNKVIRRVKRLGHKTLFYRKERHQMVYRSFRQDVSNLKAQSEAFIIKYGLTGWTIKAIE